LNKESQIKCKIAQDTFELSLEVFKDIEMINHFEIEVLFPYINKKSTKKIIFEIRKTNDQHVFIISKYGRIRINIEERDNWQRFLKTKLSQFVGLITATSIAQEKEDFLLIEQGDCEKAWILGIVWDNNNLYWDGMLVERQRPTVGPDYYLTNKKDRVKHAAELYRCLQDKHKGLGLPDKFPFFSDKLTPIQPKQKQLTIKVHPSETWFLFFPVNHFCQSFNYGRFSFYKEVEWILTLSKSFIQNSLERSEIQNELRNIELFFKHSVIILNTYPHFKNDQSIRNMWQEGTNLVKRILSLIQDIQVDNQTLSLRWHLNPNKEEILSELLRPDTWYFFADFHVEDSIWQLGTESNNPVSDDFPLNFLEKNKLRHIKLMRIFHCYSVFDPYAPKGETSIVNVLLNAGARRVEGNIMKEEYIDYICSLLHLLCASQGLQPILIGKCLEKEIDYCSLIEEVNNFLRSYDYGKKLQIGLHPY